MDWSSSNLLAVGLGNCVYLWSAHTSKVTKLCDLGADDSVTSLSWCASGDQISIGTTSGAVQLWDPERCAMSRPALSGHTARVGTMHWNSGGLLASGSRDRSILTRDPRLPGDDAITSRRGGHRQEVCGLRWSGDGRNLASGGNDNRLLVWDVASDSPVCRFNEHKAAVKCVQAATSNPHVVVHLDSLFMRA